MNAAETSASSAIADCTPETVVPRSSTTAEIDTFISEVSTTSTNIAIASRTGSSLLPVAAGGVGRSARSIAIRPSWARPGSGDLIRPGRRGPAGRGRAGGRASAGRRQVGDLDGELPAALVARGHPAHPAEHPQRGAVLRGHGRAQPDDAAGPAGERGVHQGPAH